MDIKLSVKRKACFSCKTKYPNFLFPINRMKYKRDDDLGTCKVCKLCTYRQWTKDMYAWIYNFEIRKFERVDFISKWEIIKRLI